MIGSQVSIAVTWINLDALFARRSFYLRCACIISRFFWSVSLHVRAGLMNVVLLDSCQSVGLVVTMKCFYE